LTLSLILENDAVLLRPANTDVEHLMEFSINEPDTWQLNSGQRKRKSRKYIQLALRLKTKNRISIYCFDKKIRQIC
jgi:hypothetical protein